MFGPPDGAPASLPPWSTSCDRFGRLRDHQSVRGDLGVLVPLEHACWRQHTNDRRTQIFARTAYRGALYRGGCWRRIAHFLVATGSTAPRRVPLMFYAYAALAFYAQSLIAVCRTRGARRGAADPACPRRNVYKLAALFSIDAFAGGFVAHRCVLWLFERFLSVLSRGIIFLLVEHARRLSFPSQLIAKPSASSTPWFHDIPSSVPDPGSFSPICTWRSGYCGCARLVANGCANPHLLCHGRRHAANPGRGQVTGGAASLASHQPAMSGALLMQRFRLALVSARAEDRLHVALCFVPISSRRRNRPDSVQISYTHWQCRIGIGLVLFKSDIRIEFQRRRVFRPVKSMTL